ncbi:hypothetical protein KKH43_01170 [Patescibacteria group bacterium]|nr:hypothetical protein [Patescibacteria group bacterium]
MAIIPSIEEDEARDEARDIYAQYKEQSGAVPEWVKVMAHNPKILKEFNELFKAIMGEGTVDPLLKWKVAYVVSSTLECSFCVSVTSKMLKSLGADEAVLTQLKNGEELDAKEKRLYDMVREVSKEGRICTEEYFDIIKDDYTSDEIVEIVSVVGLFNYINRFNNIFCIFPK